MSRWLVVRGRDSKWVKLGWIKLRDKRVKIEGKSRQV